MNWRFAVPVIWFLLPPGAGYAQEALVFKVLFEKIASIEKGAFLSDTIGIERGRENLPFIGVSAYCLDESVDAKLYYRALAGRQWSDWTAFRKFEEGKPAGRVAYEGPPITQKIRAIQFKSDRRVAEEIVFRLYFPPPKTGDPHFNKSTNFIRPPDKVGGQQINNLPLQQLHNSTNDCNCPQPAFCGRNCWCPSGACPPDPTPVFTTPTHIIVHHSASFNSSANFPAVVAYYWDLHVNTNGWDDIGYNWLIDAEGTVYEGRGDKRLGAHFSCMNTNTAGICLIGDFQNLAPTAAALAQLKAWLSWESCNKGIGLTGSDFHQASQLTLRHVSGHRDGNASNAPNSCAVGTVCPGGRLYEQLDAIAEEAAAHACLNARPDLVVQEMWTEPAEPLAGDTVQLFVSFKNTGAVPAAGIRWDYRIGGTTVGSDTIAALAAGETRTKFLDRYVFPIEGVFQYCIYADAVAGEPNSGNNSFCLNVSVGRTTDLRETAIVDRFAVYPNPTGERLWIRAVYKKKPEYCILQLINPMGQVVYSRRERLPAGELSVEIDLHSLPAGPYYLRIQSDRGQIARRIIHKGKY